MIKCSKNEIFDIFGCYIPRHTRSFNNLTQLTRRNWENAKKYHEQRIKLSSRKTRRKKRTDYRNKKRRGKRSLEWWDWLRSGNTIPKDNLTEVQTLGFFHALKELHVKVALFYFCLFVLMSQCGNNNELALQHGGFCTTWSLVAKGLLVRWIMALLALYTEPSKQYPYSQWKRIGANAPCLNCWIMIELRPFG